jgi:predicted alpha/beta superfamily hydrolase
MVDIFNMVLFGQERKIRVYIPSNSKKRDKKYPVLYMHDGQNVFGSEEAINGVSLELHNYLEKNNLDLMVVAIDNNPVGEERINEYCPWKSGQFSQKLLDQPTSAGGNGNQYVEFIVNELKPLIDRTYPTIENETYMAGISLGALIAAYAACTYPTIFKRVAGISSAFYRNQEEIERLMEKTDLSLLERIYFDCGTAEAGENDEISKLFLQSNQAIFDIIIQNEVKAELKVIEGAHHNYEAFKKRIPQVISYLMS